MLDPDTLDTSYTPHRVMSENGDWLTSELRNRYGAMKIHEGASPMQVTAGGITKWVMPYTVGDYALRRYKIGFGYSDVLIPSPGTEYTKATKPDTQNVWASGAGVEKNGVGSRCSTHGGSKACRLSERPQRMTDG